MHACMHACAYTCAHTDSTLERVWFDSHFTSLGLWCPRQPLVFVRRLTDPKQADLIAEPLKKFAVVYVDVEGAASEVESVHVMMRRQFRYEALQLGVANVPVREIEGSQRDRRWQECQGPPHSWPNPKRLQVYDS